MSCTAITIIPPVIFREGGQLADFADVVERCRRDDIEDKLNGIEWMVCRQIVREHDEHTGRRGCRINAVNESENLEINIELN